MQTDEDEVKCWKWSTCNVKSLKNKVAHFKQVFQEDEVVALQETHTEKWQADNVRLRLGFDGGVFSCYGPAARGTALLWRKPWARWRKVDAKDEEGRMAGAVLTKNDR